MTDTDVVTWVSVAPGITRIDLARPPANALGLPILQGLDAAVDAAEASGDVRILIIASTIPGFFAAGADIKLMASTDFAGFEEYGDALRATIERIAASDILTVAAIEGVALGGGLELAAACTMRVAGADARFGVPEVRLGLIPGAGGTQRLPRLIGRARAIDLVLTARQMEAPEALATGLIDRLVDAGGALDAALELAVQLGTSSHAALLAGLRSIDAADDLPLAAGNAFERTEIGKLFTDGEGREGIAAFVEKRTPNFEGRIA
jgi:enoyl-CoA hydratase/carnithine racemase